MRIMEKDLHITFFEKETKEYLLIQKAIRISGMPISNFCRTAALEKARRVLLENSQYRIKHAQDIIEKAKAELAQLELKGGT